ncbi:hypothetical protein BJV77DRAFT_514331 [Russula vinacea]|jgi:hypothetical protein|nr:hypothetical protein BJV77DRAFT_514331 [Russula vinacea]
MFKPPSVSPSPRKTTPPTAARHAITHAIPPPLTLEIDERLGRALMPLERPQTPRDLIIAMHRTIGSSLTRESMIMYHSQQLRCGNQRQSRPVTALPSSSSYAQSVVSSNFTLSSSATNGLSTTSSIFNHKPWRRVQDECVLNQSKELYHGISHLEMKLLGILLIWANHVPATATVAAVGDSFGVGCITEPVFAAQYTRRIQHHRLSLDKLFLSHSREPAVLFPHFQDCFGVPSGFYPLCLHAPTLSTALLRVEKTFITRTIALVGLRPLASLGIIS